MTEARQAVTHLLRDLVVADAEGRSQKLERLLEVLYPELRRLAGRLMRRERQGHTLQPTALVHEAFLGLVGDTEIAWEGRAHFLGVAARAMRQILVDHARGHRARKRGGGLRQVTLDERLEGGAAGRTLDILLLNDALERLAALDARGAQVVELRVFGGLTAIEAAEVLGVSKRTVDADWSMARLWLARVLRAQ